MTRFTIRPRTRPMTSVTPWLLRLYPAAWRARYGEEFAALLEDCRPTALALLDVFLGALDAHITPFDADGRILRMLNRPRRTAIAVFCAYVAFVVAGIGFNQMIEDDLRTLNAHPAIAAAYYVVYWGSAVSVLAILAGALPIGLAVARRALAGRRWDIIALLAVPVVALAAWLGWTLALINGLPRAVGLDPSQGAKNIVWVSWVGLFVLAAIVSAAAVSIAVSRGEVAPRLYRFALGPAAVATLAMAVMLGGVVAWGLLVRAELPAYLDLPTSPLRFPVAAGWLRDVVIMAAATLIAAIAVARAWRTPPAPAEPVAHVGAA